MQHSSRLFIGVLLSTVGLLGAGMTPVSAFGQTPADSAAVDASTRVQIEGTLIVLAGEGVNATVAATPLADAVWLVTSTGESVAITGALTEDIKTGTTFEGTLSIPAADVTEMNAVVEEALGEEVPLQAANTVDAESAVGSEILAASDTLDAPLAVVEATITIAALEVGQTATAHTLDVAVVTLPTAPGEVVMSDPEVETMTATLSTFWASQSAGQVASISRPAAVERFVSENACDPRAIWAEAALAFGHDWLWYATPNLALASHLVVIVPDSCPDDGNGVGQGSIGSLNAGGLIWAQFIAPIADLTFAHEFGHNLSLNHSNASQCTNNTVEGDACVDKPYRDYYDVMGIGFMYSDPITGAGKSNAQLMALNVTQKSRLGALTPLDLPSVDLVAGATSRHSAFTLMPASAMSGLRGLKVTDPRTGEVYFVEYRSGTGMDAGSVYSSGYFANYGLGLGVRVLQLRNDGTSAVLTRPHADPEWRPLFMQSAQSFASASGGLKVSVTGTGATAAVAVDLVATLKALTLAPVPTITGTKKVGYTLTANPGTWGPATVTLKYQWYRSKVAITGATAKTYKLAAADLGKTMTVKVTGYKTGYTTAAKTSLATTAVVRGTLSAPTPTVTGTKRVGYTLTANPGTWGPATVTLKYRWYRSGVAISYATAKTYKLVSADRYDTIKVRVVGSKTGYTSVAKYSASTVKVA